MRLTISQKINVGSMISAATILAIIAGALTGRTTLVETLQTTSTRSALTSSINQLQLITQELINHETDYIRTQDMADYLRWNDALQRLLGAVDAVDGLVSDSRLTSPELQAILEDLVLAQFEYKKSFSRIHQSIRQASQKGTLFDIESVESHHDDTLQRKRVAAGVMIDAADEMVALNQRMVAQDSSEAIQVVERIEAVVVLLAAFGFLTAVALRFFAVRTISRPLAMLSSVARRMAKGTFNHELNIRSNDEIGELARSFQEMADDLHSLYGSLEQKVKERTAELARSNANLARSNADLEQFAYVASHDLQEPLRTIAGFADLLARRYQGKLDERADEYIRFLVDGAKRMQGLIAALLDYSRVGASKIAFQPVDCGELVSEVLRSLDSAVKSLGARIIVDSLPTVLAERAQLTQLFQNLIGNAIKFHGSQPVEIRISAHEKDSAWEFSLADNGIGMERRHTERIFMIFQRLYTKDEYPGTGIGLAICKKVVERHGGTIWVESEPGRGSTFHWTIAKQSGMEEVR